MRSHSGELQRFITLHIVHSDTAAGAKNISIHKIYIVIQPTLHKHLQNRNGELHFKIRITAAGDSGFLQKCSSSLKFVSSLELEKMNFHCEVSLNGNLKFPW